MKFCYKYICNVTWIVVLYLIANFILFHTCIRKNFRNMILK